MTLGSGSTAQSCSGTTDAAGTATCTITKVNQISGTVPIAVLFASDGYYQPASAPGATGGGATGTIPTAIIASPPSSGGFVVGDVPAAATPLRLRVPEASARRRWVPTSTSGAHSCGRRTSSAVSTFAGADEGLHRQRAQLRLRCTELPQQLDVEPGHQLFDPPAMIPMYMLVVVSSSITASGSTISGNIKHLVVVQVSPGYGPAPGHDGFGQIIATIAE